MTNTTFLVERSLLRLAAAFLIAGVMITFLAGMFHPDHAPANDHAAAFAEYAASASWTIVHLGQFAGMAALIAGLLILYNALELSSAGGSRAGRLGYVSAIVAFGLYAVLQAVDGVALKQAVDAWAAAPQAEKAARFASAEAVRWLEWAVRSYHSFMLGASFLLFAAAIVETARISRGIGYLMGLSGLAYLAQGWIAGLQGFARYNTLPLLLGIVSTLAWTTWILFASWRARPATRPDRDRGREQIRPEIRL